MKLVLKKQEIFINCDPALVLTLFDDNKGSLICDYWHEPSEYTLKNRILHKCKMILTNYFLIYSYPWLLCMLCGFIMYLIYGFAHPFFMVSLIMVLVLSIIFGVAMILSSEEGANAWKPDFRRHIPLKKMEI